MAVRIEAFLALERSLADKLARSWLQMAKGLIPDIIAALQDKDYAKAEELISSIDLEPVFDENRDYIRYLTISLLLFGASRITPDVRRTAVARLRSNTVVEAAVENLRASLMGYVEDSIRDLLMDLVAEMSLADETTPISEGDTEVKSEVAKQTRIINPFVSFRERAETEAAKTLQLVASLHAVRLSAFGFTAEADVLGVSEYTISAQLDNRVCPICEYMDGKVFRVSDARTSLNEILREKDPEAMRTLQPWPKQDEESVAEFQSLSDEELVDKNWHIPPFHPNCRCLLVHTDDVPRIQDTPSYLAATGGGTGVEAVDIVAVAEQAAQREAELLAVEQSAVSYVTGQIDSTDREYGIAFNMVTGAVLKQWKGQRSYIQLDPDVDGPLLRDARFVHNHPSSYSLSLADYSVSGNYGLNSIVAIGADGSKYVGRTNLIPDDMKASYFGFMNNLQAEGTAIDLSVFGPLVRASLLTENSAQRVFSHLRNDVLREAGVVSYGMEVQGPLVADAFTQASALVDLTVVRQQLRTVFDKLIAALTPEQRAAFLWGR